MEIKPQAKPALRRQKRRPPASRRRVDIQARIIRARIFETPLREQEELLEELAAEIPALELRYD